MRYGEWGGYSTKPLCSIHLFGKEGPNIAMVMWGVSHLAENKTLYLQSLLYTTKPAKVAELREAIEHECAQIPRELFHDVCDSIAWRCQQCLDQNGCQFENRQ